jgi:hypothetical protein
MLDARRRSPSSRCFVRLAYVVLAVAALSCGAARSPHADTPPLCTGALYVPPAGAPTSTMTIVFEMKMSHWFDLAGYCLLFDGSPLVAPETVLASRSSVQSGEPLRWEGPVPRDGEHAIDATVWMRATGSLSGYRFEVKSTHRFVMAGDGSPSTIHVLQAENVAQERLERRPMIVWTDSGGAVKKQAETK